MIVITQGDDAILSLTAEDGENNPVVLTGATMASTFPNADGTLLTLDDSAHSLSNQTTNPGQYTVTLTAAQTALLKTGDNLNFYTKVTIATLVKYYRADAQLRVRSTSLI